jgi:ribosomal-protein-alanine N-acetyltransferase
MVGELRIAGTSVRIAHLSPISSCNRYTANQPAQSAVGTSDRPDSNCDRMTIQSERLDLILLTPEFMRAILRGDQTEAERLLGVSIPADWSGSENLLALRLAQIEADPAVQPWLLRAMVHRRDHIMVGRIGFHEAAGPAHYQEISPGAAEFGFEVFEPFRRQGFAREASLALMQWATQTYGVTRFVLTVRPDNLPSQALAAQLGFKRIGDHIDEIDGLEDILELQVDRQTAGGPATGAIK